MQQEKQILLDKIESIIQQQSTFETSTVRAANLMESGLQRVLGELKDVGDPSGFEFEAFTVAIDSQLDGVRELSKATSQYREDYIVVAQTVRNELDRIDPTLDEARMQGVRNESTVRSGPEAFTDPNLLVTRFGVLIIAIYLVQILINLYRYNTRLATFYRGQADTLVLLEVDAKMLGRVKDNLLPDVDYGRIPSTIPQRIAEAIGGGAAKARSRTRRDAKSKDTEPIPDTE